MYLRILYEIDNIKQGWCLDLTDEEFTELFDKYETEGCSVAADTYEEVIEDLFEDEIPKKNPALTPVEELYMLNLLMNNYKDISLGENKYPGEYIEEMRGFNALLSIIWESPALDKYFKDELEEELMDARNAINGFDF